MKLTAEEIRFVEIIRELKGSDTKKLIEEISTISEEFAKELTNYFNE